jgi:hypothetical protein
MKRPKGKLFALVAIFAALGVAAGTGAFTTVSAERTATVDVSGDSGAALGLDAAANQDYATLNSGELQITFTDVNTNAATTVDAVFTVTNNDDSAFTLSIDKSGDNSAAVDFAVGASEISESDSPTDDVGIAAGTQASLVSNSLSIGSGDSVTVGMYIDTSDKNPGDALSYDTDPVGENDGILSDVTFNADGSSATYTAASS